MRKALPQCSNLDVPTIRDVFTNSTIEAIIFPKIIPNSKIKLCLSSSRARSCGKIFKLKFSQAENNQRSWPERMKSRVKETSAFPGELKRRQQQQLPDCLWYYIHNMNFHTHSLSNLICSGEISLYFETCETVESHI